MDEFGISIYCSLWGKYSSYTRSLRDEVVVVIVLDDISLTARTWSADRSSGGEEKQINVRVNLRDYREIDPEMKI